MRLVAYLYCMLLANEFWTNFLENLALIDGWEVLGLVTGVLTVLLLIRENIWNWPVAIAYTLVSLYVFWESQLYADFGLHIVYLALNSYGWYYWIVGRGNKKDAVPVTLATKTQLLIGIIGSLAGVLFLGYTLNAYTDAALPFWDSATTCFSLAAMWLTARKKLENWYFWLFVNVMATGIYYYKGLYFYAILYFVYILLAFSGLKTWQNSRKAYLAEKVT